MNAQIGRLWPGIDERLARGAVAGLVAGLVFLLLNMGWATRNDLPAVAPLLDISTIFNIAEQPDPTPENISVGLVTHLTLSVLFGMAFAVIVPWLRDARWLAIGAVAFGVGLYLVNFQVLGRTAFPWFQDGPDQVFELFAHGVFGLMLFPFLVGFAYRPAMSAAGDGRRPERVAQPSTRGRSMTPSVTSERG